MDTEDHDRELTLLRRQMAVLTEEARKNDEAWRRAQAREMELLEADTLDALLSRLTSGLRASYRLEAATVVVTDRDHEIRRLSSPDGPLTPQQGNVLFVDSVHGVAPAAALDRRPWLGKFNRADHALLFPAAQALESVALLPLTRQERLIGCLNFGSRERERFQAALGTDFLHHLAIIAAFSLESAVNRARLVRSGFTDVLTGWHNRRYLQTRLNEELARCRRERTPLTCLMIDVDHFKLVNDRFGHLAGDEVLRQLALCVSAEIRGSDISARYGGEEFVVLLPGTGAAAGCSLAERIRAAVAQEPFELSGLASRWPVTVSIGVAEHSPTREEHDLTAVGAGLLALADAALYQAKAGGRNAVVRAANS